MFIDEANQTLEPIAYAPAQLCVGIRLWKRNSFSVITDTMSVAFSTTVVEK